MNILELAEKYDLEPQHSGGVHVCYCPFHDDTGRPNLTLYPETDSFYCFSCSKGGDAIQFVSLIEGISRQEATNKLYSSLNFLIDHLNADKKSPCNAIVNLQLSKLFNHFIKNNLDKLPQIFAVMKEVDTKLADGDLFIDEATILVQQTSLRLNSLR